MGGAPVPGPQPALVPRRKWPTSPRASSCWTPQASTDCSCPWSSPRRARRSSSRPTSSWPHARPVDQPVAGDVRPRGDRRRPRRPGRRGVRRIRGAQDRADREAPRPAGRRAAVRRSRTTSASRSASRVPSSPRRPAGRPNGSAPRSSRPGRRSSSSVNGVGAAHSIRLNDDSTIGARAVILATGVDYRQLQITGCWDDPDDPTRATTSAAACTTAPRCRTTASARARTSTSSAAPTRPARPPCTCRRRPSR